MAFGPYSSTNGPSRSRDPFSSGSIYIQYYLQRTTTIYPHTYLHIVYYTCLLISNSPVFVRFYDIVLLNMAPRTIYPISFRNAAYQGAHFAIIVPSAANPQEGTLIHAIAAPVAGYTLQFKRNYAPEASKQLHQSWAIGEVDSQHVVDSTGTDKTNDSNPRGHIEKVASQCPTPRISENFMAPVNEVSNCISTVGHDGLLENPTQTTNKRCQEWTMDFVRKLAELGYIGQSAADVIQSHRDPPNHGIGLRPVSRGGPAGRGGGAAPAPGPGGASAAGERGGSNTGYEDYDPGVQDAEALTESEEVLI
jgi:hypothetical protein